MSLKQNVPNWERGLRIVAGVALIVSGLLIWKLSGLGIAVAATGGVALLTGAAGLCPMCAIAGRCPVENTLRSRQ